MTIKGIYMIIILGKNRNILSKKGKWIQQKPRDYLQTKSGPTDPSPLVE